MNYVIYTRNDCSFCDKAKSLIRERGDQYLEVSIYEEVGALQYLKDQGFTTVPQIWLDKKHIGGYNELLQHYEGVSGGHGDNF
jgi:glutaredoxin